MTITSPAEQHSRAVSIRVDVNRVEVTVPQDRATGLEIKVAAIDAGVPIDTTFKLSLEVKRGVWRIIGDHEATDLVEGSKFRAVASDDNS